MNGRLLMEQKDVDLLVLMAIGFSCPPQVTTQCNKVPEGLIMAYMVNIGLVQGILLMMKMPL